jgi:hypothetical protein
MAFTINCSSSAVMVSFMGSFQVKRIENGRLKLEIRYGSRRESAPDSLMLRPIFNLQSSR